MATAPSSVPLPLQRWLLPTLVLATGSWVIAAPADDLADLDGDLGSASSGSATHVLIKRLIEKGVLTAADSEDLLMLAEADAQELKAQTALTRAAMAQAAAAKARARALAIQLARRDGGSEPVRRAARVEASEADVDEVPLPVNPRPRRGSRVTVTPVERDVDLDADIPPPTRVRKPVEVAGEELPPRRNGSRVTQRTVPLDLEDSPETAPRRTVPSADLAVGRAPVRPDLDEVPIPRPERRLHSASRPAPLPQPELAEEEVSTPEEISPPPPTPRAMSGVAPLPKPAMEAELPSETAATEEALAAMKNSPAPEADEVRVQYVPDSVRRQIKAEIKQEVMAQAREEGWATPRSFPSWVDRLSFYGDFRFRVDGSFLPAGNAVGQGSSFWNYNAINSSSTPYDITGDALPPFLNNDQNRTRVRVRARLGVNADLSEGFTAGLRLASGESNSPVSQNQTLGAAGSGQGGNFSKLALWMDRAFLRYERGGLPDDTTQLTVGRFERPYQNTTMIWSDDLNFDGMVFHAKRPFGESAVPFLTLGAHPVFNTDLNFGTTSYTKFKSRDKWLLGSQLGVEFDVAADVTAKFSAAYYHYTNVEGKVTPTQVLPLAASDTFEADASRPSFAQRGNTYIALRDIKPDLAGNNNGASKQWQYFGLATPYREVVLNGEINFDSFAPHRLSVFGEFAKNVAFDRVKIEANGPASMLGPVNNNSVVTTTGSTATQTLYGGSGNAWTAGVRFGSLALEKKWDWNASLAYRDVGSDAVVDAFADSDFGGGGTNQKGFILAGNLGLTKAVSLGLKWMSANQKAGPSPVKNDTIQIDINGKF